MPLNQNNHSETKEEGKFPPTNTGNASNPSPGNEMEQDHTHQLLDEKAEKYLRESASIEDVPDAQDQQDMDETIRNK